MTSRGDNQSAFFRAERGESPREFKRLTPPPPPGALEDILRRWRPSETPPAKENTSGACEVAEEFYEDEAADDDEDEDHDEEDYDESMEDTAPETSAETAASPDSAKRHRYLREADRHAILQRIDAGEKQAALAREFGVTRAAICHINKNRSQILARSTRPDVHEAARHPKRRMSSAAIAQRRFRQPPRDGARFPMVHEVPSPSLALRLSTLRSHETDSATFCAVADRAFVLLLEEALALAVSRNDGASPHETTAHAAPTCAMVLGESGLPMLKAFRALQPQSPTGFMTLARDDERSQELSLRKMSAPLGLRDRDVFLLAAPCTTSDALCTAVRALLEFGAQEARVCVVSLVVTASAATQLESSYPRVRVVTALVDDAGATVAALGPDRFVERYFNTVVVHRQRELAGALAGM